MEYPNNFNIPAFSAGKTIAFARSISIWISIVFFLIVAACGFILLGMHLKSNYPFLISVDPWTDEWAIVTYPDEASKPIPQYQIIQEKLVNDFVTDWFTISNNQQINDARWAECSPTECKEPGRFSPTNTECAIYCKSADTVFKVFNKTVLPEYKAMIDLASEKWSVGPKLITQVASSEQSSKWQVYATINSSVMGQFNILAFISIERDINAYPVTLGYYVNQFNAYRIEQ